MNEMTLRDLAEIQSRISVGGSVLYFSLFFNGMGGGGGGRATEKVWYTQINANVFLYPDFLGIQNSESAPILWCSV